MGGHSILGSNEPLRPCGAPCGGVTAMEACQRVTPSKHLGYPPTLGGDGGPMRRVGCLGEPAWSAKHSRGTHEPFAGGAPCGRVTATEACQRVGPSTHWQPELRKVP